VNLPLATIEISNVQSTVLQGDSGVKMPQNVRIESLRRVLLPPKGDYLLPTQLEWAMILLLLLIAVAFVVSRVRHHGLLSKWAAYARGAGAGGTPASETSDGSFMYSPVSTNMPIEKPSRNFTPSRN